MTCGRVLDKLVCVVSVNREMWKGGGWLDVEHTPSYLSGTQSTRGTGFGHPTTHPS